MIKRINLMFDEIRLETQEAMLVGFENDIAEWLPTSLCELDSINGVEVISVPLWLAEEKGIEVYEYE